MIGVTAQAIANHLSDDRGISRQCVLKLFKHENAGPLTHDKTVTLFIKGARSGSRLIISP
jgi:hypothetical protein